MTELTFKSAHINTTQPVEIWKPNTKEKRIRLLGYRIHGIGTVQDSRLLIAELLQDNDAMPFRQLLPISNVRDTHSYSLPSISLDTGYVLDKGKTLRIRISDALLHGFIDVLVWGREE